MHCVVFNEKSIMIKLEYLALVIIGILAACSAENSNNLIQEGKVIIEGKIHLSANYSRVISLSYSGNIDRTDTRTELIDSSGIFKFEFNILHPQDVLLKYEEGFAIIFVQASDSVHITFNSVDFWKERFPVYKIKGTNNETSRDILSYLRYKNVVDFQSNCEDKSTEEYLSDIKQQIILEESVLSAFRKTYAPTKEFLNWAKKDIIYRNANYLIDFKFHHFVNKTQYKGELFNKIIFPVNDDKACVSSMYSLHLWHYSSDNYIQKDSIVMNFLKEKKLSKAYELCLTNICENEESGISRDIMCYRILSALFEKSFEDFLSIWGNDKSFIDNEDLITRLQKRKEQFETQENYHISLMDPETMMEKEIVGDFFTNLTNKYKGKVIYLDIWATWCGPCRSEIPHSIELHEYFKHEPVVFVNLCMSSDKTEWKKAMENHHITGENYYFDKMQSDLLRNKLKWQGFPTYMIIDKNGNIVDENASRPSSDKEIKMKLIKFMGE